MEFFLQWSTVYHWPEKRKAPIETLWTSNSEVTLDYNQLGGSRLNSLTNWHFVPNEFMDQSCETLRCCFVSTCTCHCHGLHYYSVACRAGLCFLDAPGTKWLPMIFRSLSFPRAAKYTEQRLP